MKKRADTLAEYIVDRVERLEVANNRLREERSEMYERSKHHYLALREWEMPCNKTLENIKHIEKDKRGVIVICFNEHSVGEFDIANPLYPLIEKLLKEYEKKAEFERLLKKAVKCDFTPITPLTKGE